MCRCGEQRCALPRSADWWAWAGEPWEWVGNVVPLSGCSDLPCYMSLAEVKSLFRMQDIVACATQPITMLETSARDGTGLADVLQWLRATLGDPR